MNSQLTIRSHSFETIKQKFDLCARWAIIALGFSIPISTALDSILLGAILIFWLLGGNHEHKLQAVKNNKIAIIALVIFVLHVIGAIYSNGKTANVVDSLFKSTHFLLIPLIISLFHDIRPSRHALWGFSSAMVLTLIASYILKFDWMPTLWFLKGNQAIPQVFKYYLTQNIFMALALFLFAMEARFAVSRWLQVSLIILSFLTVYNVFFMVPGRTGHIVLLCLISYFFISWLRWKGVALTAIILALFIVAVFSMPSSIIYKRTQRTIEEFSIWNSQNKPQTSSTGLRLEFAKKSLQAIRKHPIIGTGLGSFSTTYASEVKNSDMIKTDNPHNQYLFTAVELGFIGLGILLSFFFLQWKFAAKFAHSYQTSIARGLILTFVVTSFFNSPLIDHSESILYCWMSGILFAGLNTSS